MEMVQVTLRHKHTQTTGWVKKLPNVKVGNLLTLKGDDRIWLIVAMSRPTNLTIRNDWWNNI